MNLTDDKSTLVQVIGAIRQQAITWANVDPDLCCHMASLGPNGLKRETRLCNPKIKINKTEFLAWMMSAGRAIPDFNLKAMFTLGPTQQQ